ncbi:MAG: SET domain-containing protein [Bacteroidetes bacterium]|nr:SET domain-containing protein [Bacteroidota bacterium]
MKNTPSLKKFSNSITYKIEAKESDYLFVNESQIDGSGKGLFTMIPIYKDEIITLFKGEILNDLESYARASRGEDGYFINLPDGTIMDSMNVKCFAKFANDALGIVKSKFKANSKITLNENGKVCIVAKRKILAGEEVFCSYGNEYWKNFKEKG